MHNKYTVRFKCARPAAFICSGLLLFTAACSRTTNRYGIGGDHGKQKGLNGFNVETWQVAHMVAQIRGKELATRDSQNKFLIAEFKDWFQKQTKYTYESFETALLAHLNNWDLISKKIDADLPEWEVVGFPIKYNKNHEQLQFAIQWIEDKQKEKAGSSIESILNGKLLHDLPNDVSLDELPVLGSPSDKNFWGNENDSVTSILLTSIVYLSRVLDKKPEATNIYPSLRDLDGAATSDASLPKIPGAATFYNFYKKDFILPTDIKDYPFAIKGPNPGGGMSLFGSFQLGGHRTFDHQFLFNPEDCSSAIAKALFITGPLFSEFTTTAIKAAYDNPDNPYKLKPVCRLHSDFDPEDLKKIKPSQIYQVKSHAAIVVKNYGDGRIGTLQFNRDIDTGEIKMEGGGYLDYNLKKEAKDKAPLLFLDTTEAVEFFKEHYLPFGHSYTLPQFLGIVDDKYNSLFPNGPTDEAGDASIFFEDKKEDKEDRKCCTIG